MNQTLQFRKVRKSATIQLRRDVAIKVHYSLLLSGGNHEIVQCKLSPSQLQLKFWISLRLTVFSHLFTWRLLTSFTRKDVMAICFEWNLTIHVRRCLPTTKTCLDFASINGILRILKAEALKSISLIKYGTFDRRCPHPTEFH
jgi:hypothetical protein